MSATAGVRGGIVRFDDNIPVEINEAKYLDLVGGKYGPQVRIKGTINGEENSLAYLPGSVADVLTALLVHGIIVEAPAQYPEPEDKRGIMLQRGATRQFTVTLSKRGGEKETIIGTTTTAAAAPAPAIINRTIHTAPPAAPVAAPVAAPLTPPPATTTTTTSAQAAATPTPDDKRGLFAAAQYLALQTACKDLAPVFRQAGIEPDADTIHKLSFELFKTWCDRGLV